MKILDVPVYVEWDKFVPGASFFVPCVNVHPVRRDILKEVARLKLEVTIKQVVENDKVGLRVWRNHDKVPPHSPSLLKD